MGFGLTLSSLLPVCVCVGLMFATTSARPSHSLEASDWSTEWQQVADLWMPKSDKDKWRAFAPEKKVSTTRWWEEKLDDDLWNVNAHETSTDKHAETQSIKPQAVLTDTPAPEAGEMVTKSQSSSWAESSTSSTKVNSLESGSGQPVFKKGEVNTFVEPDPATYYRSSGESYGEKILEPFIPEFNQKKEATVSQESINYNAPLESNNSSAQQKYKNHSVIAASSVGDDSPQSEQQDSPQEYTETDTPEVNKKLSEQQENVVPYQESFKLETSPANDVMNASHTVEEENVDVDISKDSVPESIVPVGKVVVTSSNEDNENNNLINENPDKKNHIISSDPSLNLFELKKKSGVEKKSSDSFVTDTNAIYGKGERLALPRVGVLNSDVKDNAEIETTKKPEEVTTTKTNNEFLDWDNWDDSVFEYYDNDNGGNDAIDENNTGSKEKSTTSSSVTNHSTPKEKVADDNDDEDVDDDDDYGSNEDNDDEENTDYDDEGNIDDNDKEYEVKKEEHRETTVLPTIVKKNKTKSSSRPKGVKGIDRKPVEQQSDEMNSQSDSADYINRVTFDSDYPNHKPSVKKDLTSPGNSKKGDSLPGSSKTQKPIISKSSDPQNVSVKTGISLPNQPNTRPDALTSPNPPPPDVHVSKDPAGTTAPQTSPISSSDDINLALANLGKQKSQVNVGFILSFPLEFCKVDSECRAGRTCVIGVCRCFTPGMCVGHHKPICGSDGFQYPSHCELHRVACVNRIHIRADRRGKCFQKEIEEKEKSWLMQQEKFMHASMEEDTFQTDKSIQISSHETIQSPQDVIKDSEPSAAKKAHSSTEDKASVMTEKTMTTSDVTEGKKECTWKEMGEFKESLLMFYCHKFAEPNCSLEVKTDREYLSMLLFSYCDRDYDYYLTAKEFDDKERDEHFTKNIILNCHLHDFIKYADNLEADGKLTVSEFTSAFEVPVPSTPPHVQIEVIPTLASAGNGLELKCGIDAATIIWRRHGAQLSDDKRSHQLMVFDDGALFFSTVGLHHIGNYTCMDASDESKAQIHRLKVQTLPIIEVMPAVQTHTTGSDIELKCHAEGVPKPVISWKQGGEVLQNSLHTTLYYGGGHMVIHNAQIGADAGAYTCAAHNQAGTSEKSVSVNILPSSTASSKESTKEVGTFVVFHSKGISAYDPLRCLLRHQVPGDFSNFKFTPDTLDASLTLCHKGKDCQWGEAVRVGSEFIYTCQPDQDRVVVMNAGDSWNPLQVIDTDKRPEKLWYVKHLDQVWVLCGNQEHGEGNKTIVVIRDASQHIQHRSVHTQPVGNHFDMVQDLFIAPSNDLEHEFTFGYVSHRGQNGLFKLSLEDMSYTKAIDLTNYGCVPTNIAFVPIGGHVVIQCVSAADQHTLQLIMDYLTDSITSTTSLNGHPMSSPDSRHLVTVDKLTGKVTVTSVSDDGVLETTYEVTVSASISDVAFMPAMSHQGYDLVLTSSDDDDVIIMNLVTGKVEKITGSQYSEPTNTWHPSAIHRHIISGNSMSSYLMAPSRSSLAILNAKFKQVECEFMESVGSEVMLYIPSSNTS